VPTSLLSAALVRLTATLPQCSSHEASLAVWALGKLGHTFGSSSSSSSQLHQPASDSRSSSGKERQRQQQAWHGGLGKQQRRLLNGLKPKLAGMSGRDLVTLLYGLALQHSRPPAAWQAAALAAVLPRLHQLDGQGLSNLLYALGLLSWQPNRQWQLAFWEAVVTQVQLPQQQPAHQQQQQQQGKARHRRQQQQQQQQGDLRSSWGPAAAAAPQAWPQAAGVSAAGPRVLPGAVYNPPGFAPRSWELLLEGQRLLGWQLPLAQLQLLQRHGQLHRLGQAQLGSWARQAGLSAAAAAAVEPAGGRGASGSNSQHTRPRQQQQLQQQQHGSIQTQVQQQQQHEASSGNGRRAAGAVAVQQLRVLPPVQLPASQLGAMQQSSSAASGRPDALGL
jgi:hypothetical protein